MSSAAPARMVQRSQLVILERSASNESTPARRRRGRSGAVDLGVVVVDKARRPYLTEEAHRILTGLIGLEGFQRVRDPKERRAAGRLTIRLNAVRVAEDELQHVRRKIV